MESFENELIGIEQSKLIEREHLIIHRAFAAMRIERDEIVDGLPLGVERDHAAFS